MATENLEFKITAIAKDFDSTLNQVEQKLKGLNKTSDETGAAAARMSDRFDGAAKKFAPVSAAAAGAIGATVKLGSDFQAQMGKVSAISGTTGDDLIKLKDKAFESTKGTKFSAQEAAQAYEYMGMAGWNTGQMLSGLPPILDLATASGEELGLVSDIVTDALTAFGLSANDSAHFADVLAATATSANTNVGMMGETFQYVAPVAGALGYSVEDTSLAIGLMANAGIKGSKAGTTLRTAMTNLISPTDSAAALLEEMGVKTKDAEGNVVPFRETLDKLRESFKGMTPAMQAQAAEALFGKEAMSGMLAVLTASDDEYNGLADSIDNANGSAAEMAKTVADSDPIAVAVADIKDSFIKAGEAIMPIVAEVAKKISELAQAFAGLSPETQKMLLKALAITAAVAPLLKILGSVSGIVSALQVSAGALGLSTGLLVGKIALIAGIIAGVVAAGVLLYKNWDKIKETADKLGQKVEAVFQGIDDFFNAFFDGVKQVFSDGWNAIKDTTSEVTQGIVDGIKGTWEGITGFFSELWGGIKDLASTIWGGIKDLFMAIWEPISPYFEVAWGFIRDVLTDIWSGISEVANTVWGALGEFFTTVWDGVTQVWQDIWNPLSEFLKGIWEGIKEIATAIWEPIKDFFVNIWKDVSDWWIETWASIKETMTGIWDSFKELVSSIWEPVKTYFSELWTAVKDMWVQAWEDLKNTLSDLWNSIKELATGVWESIKDIISTITQGIADVSLQLWENFFNGLRIIWDGIKTTVSATWTFIKDTIRNVWEAVKTITRNIWEGIKNFLKGNLDGVKQNFLNIFTAIKDLVTNIFNSIKDFFTTVMGGLLQTTRDILGNIFNTFRDIFSNVFNAVRDKMGNVVSAVTDGLRNALSSATNFISNFVNLGWEIASGIARGILNGIGNVINAITNVVSSALDSAMEWLGIASPSRVFRDNVGKWIPEGMAVGIENNTGNLTDSMQDVSQLTLDNLNFDGNVGRGILQIDEPSNIGGGATGQAAYLTLVLGNRSYKAFVDDITNIQNEEVDLVLDYGV